MQLKIEEIFSGNQLASQSKKQLFELLNDLNLPTSLKRLGMESITSKDLETACSFSCKQNSDIHNLPFVISKDILMKAILDTEMLSFQEEITSKRII